MDKNEIATLLESLCDRPFAGDPDGRPATDASAGGTAPTQPSEPSGPSGTQSDDPGRVAAELASILSGTATQAQCQTFQEAAVTSSAVRLEARSALGLLDGIDATPLKAPAHLVEQVLPIAGATPPAQPGIWSRLARRPGRQAVAACAVMLMAGGLSWSLLWRGNLIGDRAAVPPAIGPQSEAPIKGIEPAPVGFPAPSAPMLSASPTGSEPPTRSEFMTQPDLPARSTSPLLAPPLPVSPASPAFAPVIEPAPSTPSPAQALTDPCGPRSVVTSEARTRSKVEAKAVKPPPSQPPRTAALSQPDPGCGVGVGAVEADQGAVRANRPAARINRSDREAPGAATSAPAYAPAAPPKRPTAIVPPR